MDPQAQTPQEPQQTPAEQPIMQQPPAMGAMPMTEVAAQPMTATASSAPSATNPGHGLGVAGLIFAFFIPLVGFILSVLALSKSKKAGMKNGLALAGAMISVVNFILGFIIMLGFYNQISSVQNGVKCYSTTTSGQQVEIECSNSVL